MGLTKRFAYSLCVPNRYGLMKFTIQKNSSNLFWSGVPVSMIRRFVRTFETTSLNDVRSFFNRWLVAYNQIRAWSYQTFFDGILLFRKFRHFHLNHIGYNHSEHVIPHYQYTTFRVPFSNYLDSFIRFFATEIKGGEYRM